MLRLALLCSFTLAAALTSGFAHAQAPGSDIVVAQIGPFTVLPAPDPKELNEGIKAALVEINANGGIRGQKVTLLTLDDAYSFEGFQKQFAKALERKPLALLAPVGSSALNGMLKNKLLDQNDVLVINAIPGASILRDPGHPKFFHIRAGDEQQIEKIITHARSLNIDSMGVMYQDIPMGTSGLASAQRVAKDIGEMAISGFPSSADGAAIKQAASDMARTNPRSALVVGPPKFAGEAIAALRAAGISQQIFTLSYLPAPALLKFAGQGARGVGIAQTYPNPSGVRLPLQRDFRAAMKTAHPTLATYTTFHMEGYITARVFAEAARRSSRLTPEAIGQTLRTMGEIDFGGFRVNFDKHNVGSRWVDIGVATGDGKLLY